MFDYLNEVLFIYGKNRRNNTYKQAMALKKRGDAYLFNLLCQEYINRFKWTYEPADGVKTIATELIERTILFGGAVGFAKYVQSNGTYQETTWRNFRVSGMDDRSFYGYPNQCTLTDYSGKVVGKYIPTQKQDLAEIANCSLIYDNFQGWNPLWTIFYYVERLSGINASINACVKNILGTSIISCSREQARDVERQRQSASIGVPYLVWFDDGDVRPPEIKLISTPGASEELKTLYEAFDKTHHDYLQSIGIRVNNEMNKKSGITPIEIIENRMNVDIILNSAYEARKEGIEMAKKIGLEGLSVSLDNFESLIGDYDKNGNRITNVDPEASEINKDVKDNPEGGEDNNVDL